MITESDQQHESRASARWFCGPTASNLPCAGGVETWCSGLVGLMDDNCVIVAPTEWCHNVPGAHQWAESQSTGSRKLH